MSSAFTWKGQPSELLQNDPKMAYVKKSPVNPSNQPILNRWATINTDTMLPADKTRLIQRGNAR